MANVYLTRDELNAVLGAGLTTGIEDRLDMACIVASRWVDYRVGNPVGEDDLEPPYTLTREACPPAWTAAALVVAVRFFKAPDVPFGVMTVGEGGMSVKTYIPEAEMILFGHRVAFGFA